MAIELHLENVWSRDFLAKLASVMAISGLFLASAGVDPKVKITDIDLKQTLLTMGFIIEQAADNIRAHGGSIPVYQEDKERIFVQSYVNQPNGQPVLGMGVNLDPIESNTWWTVAGENGLNGPWIQIIKITKNANGVNVEPEFQAGVRGDGFDMNQSFRKINP